MFQDSRLLGEASRRLLGVSPLGQQVTTSPPPPPSPCPIGSAYKE